MILLICTALRCVPAVVIRCDALQGIQPEVRTYNTIITACNKSGKPEEGLKIYERMVAAGVKASATTYTALISAYGKQGKVEKAMEIFAGGLAGSKGAGDAWRASWCAHSLWCVAAGRPDIVLSKALTVV
jgi:pentatricopeptide repeat protein